MASEKPQKVLSKKHVARLERERIQTRNLMIAALAIIVIVVGLIGFAVLNQYVLLGQKAVARVNNEKITVNEFKDQVRFDRWQLVRQYQQYDSMMQVFGSDPTFSQQIQSSLTQIQTQLDPASAETVGSQALDELISSKVIEQEAAKRNITVSDAEVEKALQENFGYYANGTPTPTTSPTIAPTSTLSPEQEALLATSVPAEGASPTETPAEPTAAPTQEPSPTATQSGPTGTPAPTGTPFPTATPYTVEGYQGELSKLVDEIKTFGYSEAKLRQVIRTNLLEKKLYDEITADVKPVQEQVWARHILVQDQTVANQLYDELMAGKPWDQVASEIPANDPNNPNAVNTTEDLGWFTQGTMDPNFEAVAWNLKVGEISKPVKSSFGWHIIQVLGHEDRPLTESQLQQAKQTAYSDWLTQAKSSDNVVETELWKDNIPLTPDLSMLSNQQNPLQQ